MKKNNMMTMVMVVGGIGVAYWYLTRYGPQGAAYNASGQQIAATWWDTWFGGSAQVAAQTSTNTGTTTSQTPSGSTTPPPSTTTDIRTRLLTAAGGVTQLNADQWNYYRNSLFPPALTPNQFGAAFPVRVDPMPNMTVDQFLASLVGAGVNPANPNAGVSGIRGVIPVPAVPPIPSMSFGGSLATARPRIASPSVFRNRPVGGVTIQ